MTKAIVETPKVVLDHFELVVQPNKLDTGVKLFVRLFGWVEVCERAVSGEWGKSRFVKPTLNSDHMVQLSDYARPTWTDEPWPIFDGHLALKTQNPMEIIGAIQTWSETKGFSVELEDVGQGKWLITVRGLLAQQLEIVPV